MGRAPRIDHPGAWHHVGHRGLDGRAIFIDDADRRHFCTLLGDVLERFGLETHAWCLMGNHHHLLVRSVEGRLSPAMQYLNAVYTQRFNWRHDRQGALLRGRFHSTRIDTDAYLAAVSRYIHRNPVEAGIVASPEQYRWSSYRGYLNARDADPWLQRDEILGRHGGNRMAHHRYVTDSTECAVAAVLGHPRPAALLDETLIAEQRCARGTGPERVGVGAAAGVADAGSATVADPGVRSSSDRTSTLPCADAPSRARGLTSSDVMAGFDRAVLDAAVAAVFGVGSHSVRSGGRGRTNAARLAAVALAHEVGRATQGDIARWYGFSSVRAAESAMRRAAARRVDDPEFAAALAEIEIRLRTARAA